jgi:hypothetical protein
MKKVDFNFSIYHHNIICFSLEWVIFVTDNGFDELIRLSIKDYLK